MALVTINAFYSNGVPVGSCNVRLNSEGRLPGTALENRFNAQHVLNLDRADGVLLVADQQGFSTRPFAASGPVTVFLQPKPVEPAEDFNLTMGFMQLLHFAQTEAHARTRRLFIMLYNLCQPDHATTECLHAGRDDKNS